jgi:hypothetical protein
MSLTVSAHENLVGANKNPSKFAADTAVLFGSEGTSAAIERATRYFEGAIGEAGAKTFSGTYRATLFTLEKLIELARNG